MKNILAVTNCEESLKESFGYYKLINSWKYFHPDIEIVNWGDEETNRIKNQYKNFDLWSFMPIVMMEAKKRYNADLVIKLDSDSIILDRFSEIIDCEDGTEIFGVRNDGDHFTNEKYDERINRPQIIRNIPNELYLNCGLISTNCEDFLTEWYELNKFYIEKYGDIRSARNELPMVEQGSYNIICANSGYKVKILDELGNGLHYGASTNGPSLIDGYGNPPTQWRSWNDIKYKNYNFWLNNKKVKCIHQAGGNKKLPKLTFDMFNPKLLPILKEITKSNE